MLQDYDKQMPCSTCGKPVAGFVARVERVWPFDGKPYCFEHYIDASGRDPTTCNPDLHEVRDYLKSKGWHVVGCAEVAPNSYRQTVKPWKDDGTVGAGMGGYPVTLEPREEH